MKQFIISISVSLIALYLIVAFISLTPNVAEWDAGGRGAYLAFGIIFGIIGHIIYSEDDKSTRH
jgi:hypothetical protein